MSDLCFEYCNNATKKRGKNCRRRKINKSTCFPRKFSHNFNNFVSYDTFIKANRYERLTISLPYSRNFALFLLFPRTCQLKRVKSNYRVVSLKIPCKKKSNKKDFYCYELTIHFVCVYYFVE